MNDRPEPCDGSSYLDVDVKTANQCHDTLKNQLQNENLQDDTKSSLDSYIGVDYSQPSSSQNTDNKDSNTHEMEQDVDFESPQRKFSDKKLQSPETFNNVFNRELMKVLTDQKGVNLSESNDKQSLAEDYHLEHSEQGGQDISFCIVDFEKEDQLDSEIIMSETSTNHSEDLAINLSEVRLNHNIHYIYHESEEIIHHKKVTMQDVIESPQNTTVSFKFLNQDSSIENGENEGVNDDQRENFSFEDALLPEDLEEIQTLYDAEQDMLKFSSNYQISDQLNTILSYKLDGRTVEEVRDTEDEIDDQPVLSPIRLRPRENKKYVSDPESLINNYNEEYNRIPYDERHDTDLQSPDLTPIPVNDLSYTTLTIGADDSQSKILDEPITDIYEENSSTDPDVSIPEITVSNDINLTTQQASCDNSELIVQTSDVPRWKKEYSSPYCHKIIVGQLPRHIRTVHREHEDVKKLNSTLKGSEERKQLLSILRNHGSFTHNTNKNFNKGQLIVSRRPKTERKATDYTTCPYCLAPLVKSNARKHIFKCRQKRGEVNTLKGQRVYYVMGKSIEARLHTTANDILRLVVFPVLQEDEIVRLIGYDWLIILYGNKLCIKYTPHYQHNMIRARLRLIGRFLHAAQQLNSAIKELSDIFYPKCIETVIKAIGKVARINYLKNECEAPAVALNLVTYLRQIAVILETEYVLRDNEERQKHVSNFLKVYNSEMSIAVNKIACESQAKLRRHKIIVLPVTKDIQKLILYIKTEKKNCFETLKTTFEFDTWLKASKLVAAYLLIFNRRRVGDIQNMTLFDMTRLQSIDQKADKEEFNALDQEGKKIAASYCRIEIRGKLNRDVAVIASNEIVKEIKFIIQCRELANVPADNEFIFGLPSGVNGRIRVLNLCTIMRELSVDCGAEKPELLRGTYLRKHVATKCIKFELSENVLSDLTKHMGHSEKIHKDIYQRPIKSKTIVQVTKLLHAVHGPVNDEELEKEDVYTNDRSEFIEFDNDDEMNNNEHMLNNPNEANENVEQNSSESNLIYDDFVPTYISQVPEGSKIIADNILENSGSNISVVMNNSGAFKNQSTPKQKTVQNKPPEICTSVKKPWTDEQKRIVLTEFRPYMIKRTLPSLKAIDHLKEKYPCLNDRRRDTIKTWISNQYKKTKSSNLNDQKGIKVVSNEKKNYKMKNLSKNTLDL